MTVSPLQGITHACFGLSYLCAFLLELARLVWPGKGWRIAGLVFGTAGVFAQTAYLLLNQPPLAAPYGSLGCWRSSTCMAQCITRNRRGLCSCCRW
jgi:uncharacterized protein involved in response to NO